MPAASNKIIPTVGNSTGTDRVYTCTGAECSTVQYEREGEREEPARHIGALARSAVLSFLPLIITGVAMATAATRSRSVQHYAASLPPSLFYLSLLPLSSLSLYYYSRNMTSSCYRRFNQTVIVYLV